MNWTRTLRTLALAVLLLGAPPLEARQTPQQSPAQEGFVPVDQLPAEEQLPAAPLVAAAYGVAWGAVLVYVWSLWRRLNRVERELADVAKRITPGARQ
jgi:CcmD family protein